MFKATKPFRDTITDYPQQPSLRIGRTVPKEAVNLAYYFNPTATDTEKVLTADAPRNTIDHRVEEAYRYLFDQASDDDDLFPGYVTYEDEEGYTGKLGRMFVQWYPETHVLTKHIFDVQQDVIVTNKADVLKIKEYSDLDGYSGNLFLDVVTYEVSKTKDDTAYEQRDREIRNFELVYHDIFHSYIPQGPGNAIDFWMLSPLEDSGSPWPKQINIALNGCSCIGTNNVPIRNYVSGLPNTVDDAVGTLDFDHLEYEHVEGDSPSTYTPGSATTISFGSAVFKTRETFFEGNLNATTEQRVRDFMKTESDKADNLFKEFYGAEYNTRTGKYEYNKVPTAPSDPTDPKYDDDEGGYEEKFRDQKTGSINQFLNLIANYCSIPNGSFKDELQQAMRDKDKDIAIYRTGIRCVINDTSELKSKMHFEATYECIVSPSRPTAGQYAYNVIAVYSGTLKKTVVHQVQIAIEYKATCHYSGIVRKTWETYDGMAYYRGAVTKGNSIGNVNPEDDNEILMFPDLNGYLRRVVYKTDQDGNTYPVNYYKVETNYAYLTDVFKNGVACFWKYNLKKPIYDYRGPDARGFYEGDAVQVFTSALKDLPSGYEYNMKLVPAEYETVSQINSGFVPQQVRKPMRYSAELFTSFMSTATDTYKVTYNAFDDNDRDNVALQNGVTEEIYSYPFMIQNRDFVIETINLAERTSRIKMNSNYENYIEDTRRYITFTFKVIAERKQQYGPVRENETQELIKNHRRVESYPITVSILNRDYALPIEYSKFDGRGMIVSPQSDGIYRSPFDIILDSQAAHPPVPQDVNGIYIDKITDIHEEELEYNPDWKYEQQKVYRKISDADGEFVWEQIGRYEEYENVQEVFITSKDTDFYFYTEITECEAGTRGGINLKCNPDGSGYITAETTIDTGFWNPVKENWTKKLSIDNPYFIEECEFSEFNEAGEEVAVKKLCIFPGIKVKCIDARHIKVLSPKEDGLLDSWYPRIQFGHYSQILDQYGTHTKVCYAMPEYDTQHFSTKYLAPYVDIDKEKVEILNSHMVRTKCFPLYNTNNFSFNTDIDQDTYFIGGKGYKVFRLAMSQDTAERYCNSLGGRLAIPQTKQECEFIEQISMNYYNTAPNNMLMISGTFNQYDTAWHWGNDLDVTDATYTYQYWAEDAFDNPIDVSGIIVSPAYQVTGANSDGSGHFIGVTSEPLWFIGEFNDLRTIRLYKKVGNDYHDIDIQDISFSDGIIITKTAISENDNIVCDYTYLEESYVYRGFWKTEQDFARIDLNPNIYHTYSDTTYSPSATKPTKNLFNKVIYFYMRPSVIFEITSQDRDDLEFDFDNPEYEEDQIKIISSHDECLYHKIDDCMPDEDWDIYVGSIYIRQNTSLHSTILIDGRTRGGGLIESMKDTLRKQLEPESDYYLDIGYYDGEPYQENGVIIVRLDQRLLQDFGGRFTKGDIEIKVKRWLGFGVYPIIEYVDTFTKRDMPQHSLVVDDSYGNIIDITPEIYLEYLPNL